MQYHIHQLIDLSNDALNAPKEYAGFVEAESLEEAYMKAQNWDDPWNPTNPCRSTSVGDIIQSDNSFFIVERVGFKKLD